VNIAIASRLPRPRLTDRPATQRATRAIAHRGASNIAPENTLLAYRLAVEFGVDAIEVDARLTRDGVVVLLHDADVSRTTNGTGTVDELLYEELRRCDAGYWFCPEGHPSHPFRGLGITVPTLADLFNMLDRVGPAVEVVVELKNSPFDTGYDPDQCLARRVVSELRERDAIDRCRISSFNAGTIDHVKRLEPALRTAYLATQGADVNAKIAYAVAKGHDAVHAHDSAVAAGAVERRTLEAISQAGLEVAIWTVNERARMAELAALGVDGIITDDPERLCALLDAARSVTA
jgi:glycerophosphoryl diester phosphodiesterase